MGWSGGSELMSSIIGTLAKNGIEDDVRYEIYKDLIPVFEAEDCDTLYECAEDDDMFHKALYELDQYYREDYDDQNSDTSETEEDLEPYDE